MKKRSVFVAGSAISTSWADATCSLEDLIFRGVKAALLNADVPIDAIDSVVLSAHDLVDGRSLSSMVTAPAAGAYLKDEIRLADDGLVALSLGGARVVSGESEFTIVAAWGRASEGDLTTQSRAAMDPFYAQPFGLTEADISAFRLSRWLSEYGPKEEWRANARRARTDRARRNRHSVGDIAPMLPVNGPLMREEAPRLADIVVAAVICARQTSHRIAGVGHATDVTALGERQWLERPALRKAVDSALSEAGTTLEAIDLFEIDGMTLTDEALALEALGLALPGQGFELYSASRRINASGGSAAGWCYPAMGLVRFVECVQRLETSGQRALAVGSGPIGDQTQTAVVVEAL